MQVGARAVAKSYILTCRQREKERERYTYIHTYIHTHTNTHRDTDTHTHREREREREREIERLDLAKAFETSKPTSSNIPPPTRLYLHQ